MEEKKAERFDKSSSNRRRLSLTGSEETKMLTIKMLELDPDAVKIVQAYHARMLKCLAANSEESDAQ